MWLHCRAKTSERADEEIQDASAETEKKERGRECGGGGRGRGAFAGRRDCAQ